MTPLDEHARPLLVLSHPNHELAVFGFLQRCRPQLLYLTDGGGEARVDETRRGLDSIGLLDRAQFLNLSESACYEAVLRRDIAWCEEVSATIQRAILAVHAQVVMCDAVEFYNPVHDISLLLVQRAARRWPALAVFEVPIIYQRPGTGEAYEVQRLPPSRQAEQVVLPLTAAEVAVKQRARDTGYRMLRGQMGPLLDLPASHLAVEVFARSAGPVPVPDAERAMRYEWRGRRLAEQGAVAEVITYADHYGPLAAALRADAAFDA